jgi:hypothetical protein
MRVTSILAIALIIVGMLAMAYQGITYTIPKKSVDVGPIHVTKDEKHKAPLTPVLGAIALIGGIMVLVFDQRNK